MRGFSFRRLFFVAPTVDVYLESKDATGEEGEDDAGDEPGAEFEVSDGDLAERISRVGRDIKRLGEDEQDGGCHGSGSGE